VEQLYSFDAERKIDGATSIASFCSPRRDNVNGLWGGGYAAHGNVAKSERHGIDL